MEALDVSATYEHGLGKKRPQEFAPVTFLKSWLRR